METDGGESDVQQIFFTHPYKCLKHYVLHTEYQKVNFNFNFTLWKDGLNYDYFAFRLLSPYCFSAVLDIFLSLINIIFCCPVANRVLEVQTCPASIASLLLPAD